MAGWREGNPTLLWWQLSGHSPRSPLPSYPLTLITNALAWLRTVSTCIPYLGLFPCKLQVASTPAALKQLRGVDVYINTAAPSLLGWDHSGHMLCIGSQSSTGESSSRGHSGKLLICSFYGLPSLLSSLPRSPSGVSCYCFLNKPLGNSGFRLASGGTQMKTASRILKQTLFPKESLMLCFRFSRGLRLSTTLICPELKGIWVSEFPIPHYFSKLFSKARSSLVLPELALLDIKFNYCIIFYERSMSLKFNELIFPPPLIFSGDRSI